MTKIYTELLKNEFDLTVITGHFNSKNTKSIRLQNDDGITVIRIPFIRFGKPGFFWRLLTILSFSCACILVIRHISRDSVIYTCGPPEVPYFAVTAQLIRFLRSAKQVGLVTDMIPDVAFDIGLIKSKSLRKIITSFCVWGYKKTDHIVTITEDLKKRLIEYGITEEKISLIGTAVDTDKFKPKPLVNPQAIELESKNSDKFIVLYSGSFGKMYDFDPLLEAAKFLQETKKSIFFIIRGDGEQRSYLSKRIADLGLHNTILLGPVDDTEDIISFINIATVCVIPIRDSRSIDMTHPSKIFEFFACYKPIICATRGNTADLIQKWKVGIAISPNDSKAVVDAILFLFNNSKITQQMGNNARELVTKQFSYHTIREQLTTVMKKYVRLTA